VHVHREFPHESVGERIVKICPHLPKLLSNIKWLSSVGTQHRNSLYFFLTFLPMLSHDVWQAGCLSAKSVYCVEMATDMTIVLMDCE